LKRSDKEAFFERQTQLQSKIDDFHQKIQSLFGNFNWDDNAGLAKWLNSKERLGLLLPSTLGKERCEKIGWRKMMDQELKLRIGQANNSLEKLRLDLGHKAVVFKVGVRTSDSQATKTRSQSDLDQVNKKVAKHSRSYQLAYQAMLKLGASEKDLERFQPLTPEDCKVSTDLVEENRVGQRSNRLSWIWRQKGGDSEQEDKWMKEGE
jgi:hypothetical protein